MSEDDLAKAMMEMSRGEKDRLRKMLHGTSKNHTQENNFKLLKNNGKRDREEDKSEFNLSRKKYKLKAPSKS